MLELLRQWITTVLLFIIAVFLCGIFAVVSITALGNRSTSLVTAEANVLPANSQPRLQTSVTPMPSATVQPSATATNTLKPPPTFEPATSTPLPSSTPSITPVQTIETNISVQGLNGIPAPTLTKTTEGCKPRDDWSLTYTVQFDDALVKIAEIYGTTAEELAQANCLADINLITVGQQLRVPGTSASAAIAATAANCETWEVLAPHDNSFSVAGEGELTFNWRGPVADRYLVRIFKPEGGAYEAVVDLRQNATIDLDDIPTAGRYTWQVYPLDQNFQQTACKESPFWSFTKPGAPTPTPTATATVEALKPSFIADRQNGVAPLTVNFFNQSRGEITAYAWDFGDGTTSSEPSPTHTYANPGSYFVKMTIYGPYGLSDFTTTLIVVN